MCIVLHHNGDIYVREQCQQCEMMKYTSVHPVTYTCLANEKTVYTSLSVVDLQMEALTLNHLQVLQVCMCV